MQRDRWRQTNSSPSLQPALADKTCIQYEFDFPILSLIDELAGAGVEACGAGRPAVILIDRSEDRDNHGCYEQHFITVTFGQNSICRCRPRPPPLSLRHVWIVRKIHAYTCACAKHPPPHALLTVQNHVRQITGEGLRIVLEKNVLQTLCGPHI